MTREQLEHVLRAAGAITGAGEFVLIGSQSILGQFPKAPPSLTTSTEIDLFTLRDPNDAVLVDGSIGEGSPFHAAFGYYAHGVGIETATLPADWRSRLIPISSPATGGVTGLCLEVHDLAVSKLAAGRDKDLEFVAAVLSNSLADAALIAARIDDTEVDASTKQRIRTRLQNCLHA